MPVAVGWLVGKVRDARWPHVAGTGGFSPSGDELWGRGDYAVDDGVCEGGIAVGAGTGL